MALIQSSPAAELFAAEQAVHGYVPGYVQVFAAAPEIYADWAALNRDIKHRMTERRYELVTLAAARRLRSSYCALAHGRKLNDLLGDAGTVEAIARDHRNAGLSEAEVAAMDLAELVVTEPNSLGPDDVERLHAAGLSDADIFDVVVTAAARTFFSTVIGALDARPDAALVDALEPGLRDVLTVGRPAAPMTAATGPTPP